MLRLIVCVIMSVLFLIACDEGIFKLNEHRLDEQKDKGEITLEQIIKAVGSVEALSLLFYQGVMEELTRRDVAFDVLKQDGLEKDETISRLKHELAEMTRERNRIMREYNEKMAKVKVGTLTLDQVEKKLIPKR